MSDEGEPVTAAAKAVQETAKTGRALVEAGDKMISPDLMVVSPNTSMVVVQLIEQERNKVFHAAIQATVVTGRGLVRDGDQPAILLQSAVVDLGKKTTEGHIIQAITVPWFRIFEEIKRNPDFLFEFPQYPHRFEEFIAGVYDQDGWEVTLTPRSGDLGRDVIATKPGHMAIRILDQCKAFSPGRVVNANDVRALAGVLLLDQNVSKGIVTTTSRFASGVQEEFEKLTPYRFELRDGPALIEWLRQVAGEAKE